jgi:hypothetical protein
MWNVVLAVARRYAPVATLPIAMVLGFIGYNAESVLSDKTTPSRTMTVAEERDERILRELEGENVDDGDTRYSKTLPKTVLDRNEFRKGARDSTVKADH